MESQSSEKRGEGVPPSLATAEAAAQCQYTGPGGRRCRMLPAPGMDVCSHHDRILAAEEPRITDATANHLLEGVDQFEDAEEVKLFLRNLVRQVIRQRVGRRDAAILAYLSQLMLNCEAVTLAQYRDEDRREAAEALAKSKQPLEIIWDIPGPPKDNANKT